ncbi:hypothetical protein [Paenibacillus dendritiformis]|uniref:hypothetical protein n=1 Tax=Paenibacillus dendritiformis TaxID=130049 RepID=UPI001C65F122|nr:hypothetical protein [Paenibacillus dendritiformis]
MQKSMANPMESGSHSWRKYSAREEMDVWLKEYDKRAADMKFNDIKLPQAPGTPAPDGWGGKVTSLEGLSPLNPDHLILMSDSESNVLEGSSIWDGVAVVKSGRIYQMTTRMRPYPHGASCP